MAKYKHWCPKGNKNHGGSSKNVIYSPHDNQKKPWLCQECEKRFTDKEMEELN